MPLYRPGHVMAAIYQDDDSNLMTVERLIYRFICLLGPYKRASRERWLFGQRAALEIYEEGLRNFLVPGAGIPTSGHVHQLLPDAKVLYVDKDETIVRMAQEMLGSNPNVRYVQGDLREWAKIEPHCLDFFGPSPKVGIIFIGTSYFFPDEALGQLFRALYAWAGVGSKMIVDNSNSEAPRPFVHKFGNLIYAVTGNRLYRRNDRQFRALLGPWHVERMQPLFYLIPHGLTFKPKMFDELTEEEREIPPVGVAYKVCKLG